MVQSTAASVDEFMEGVGAERIDAVRQLRALCREHLSGWQERMQWRMPGYGPARSDAVVSFKDPVVRLLM